MAETEGTWPAFPHDEKDGMGGHYYTHLGLTKREYFAIQIAQGMVLRFQHPNDLARNAVKAADALLEELSK